MTSLDFLYIALGGGFILFIIFLCVVLLQVALILRDVTKVTANVTTISERVKETVLEPLKALSEMTAGLGFVHDLIEKIREKTAKMHGSCCKDMPCKCDEDDCDCDGTCVGECSCGKDCDCGENCCDECGCDEKCECSCEDGVDCSSEKKAKKEKNKNS